MQVLILELYKRVVVAMFANHYISAIYCLQVSLVLKQQYDSNKFNAENICDVCYVVSIAEKKSTIRHFILWGKTFKFVFLSIINLTFKELSSLICLQNNEKRKM